MLLGPIRAMSYTLLHGLLAATMGTTWKWKWNFWLSIVVCGVMRMLGQLAYLLMSSFTMNENLFALLLSNVFTMLVSRLHSFAHTANRRGMHAARTHCVCWLILYEHTLLRGQQKP